MSLCVENIWPRVKEVNMTFLESSSPCLINMEKKKKPRWYFLVTHPNIFRAVVTKEHQLFGYLLQVSFWQDQSQQRLHLSAWQFHLSEGRVTTEEKWLLWSDFWSVQKKPVGKVEIRISGECVYVVLETSQNSQSFSFRSYFCYFSSQYCHLYTSLIPQECSLRTGIALCHLCVFWCLAQNLLNAKN